jgi:MFS family permease
MNPIRQNARILSASLIGTAIEYFDFYIFGTAAALVFGPLFFPTNSPEAQQMASFMAFGLAFFARPLGAIAFGHFGDRVGRKATLVASLLTMGVCTVLIGTLPGYDAIGLAAPVLLCILRFGQGFGLGGEWGGAALLAVENAPKGWESRFGAAPQLGAPLGFLFSNGLFLILGLSLSDADFISWGWRIPFIASAVLVGVGLWIRLNIFETRAFAESKTPHVNVPIGTVFREHFLLLLLASTSVVAAFATFYLATTFALSYGTKTLHMDRQTLLMLQLGANCFLAIGVFIGSYAADRWNPTRIMLIGSALTTIIGLTYAPAINSHSLMLIFWMFSASQFAMGIAYGPLSQWLSQLFPVRVRYTAISLAFTIGGLIGGALTPLIAQKMSDTGHFMMVGWILTLAGAITFFGIKYAKPAPQ